MLTLKTQSKRLVWGFESKAPLYGLTGGIASGKTTAQKYFEGLGIVAIDQDLIARQVVAPGTLALQQIQTLIQEPILLENGELDRKKLRGLIFNHKDLKSKIESIIHPLVRQVSQAQILQAESPYILLVSPLLIEAKLYELVDKVIIVDIPREEQFKRLIERDNISEELANQILDQQVDRTTRLSHADYILHNKGSLESLLNQILELDQKLRQ